MQFILLILKILGIALGSLLGILLIVLLLVLFFPLGYQVKGHYSGDYGVTARAYWLFHALSFWYTLEKDSGSVMKITVFGITLGGRKKDNPSTGDRKTESTGSEEVSSTRTESSSSDEFSFDLDNGEIPEESNLTVREEIETIPEEDTADVETGSEADNGAFASSPQSDKECIKASEEVPKEGSKECEKESCEDSKESVEDKIRIIIQGITDRRTQISDKVASLKGEAEDLYGTLTSKEVEVSIALLKKEIRILLRQILPRELKGKVNFGLDDPAMTGEIYGALVTLLLMIPRTKVVVDPDFANKVIDLDLTLKGRITIALLLPSLWRLYRSKELRKAYKDIRRNVNG